MAFRNNRSWIRVAALAAAAALAFETENVCANSIVTSSDKALPLSLQNVVSALQATVDEDNEGLESGSLLPTAPVCLVTSRSVTHRQRKTLLGQLLVPADDDDLSRATAVGTKEGVVLALPAGLNDVLCATSAMGSKGSILFAPDPVDLKRGEGLFDSLAPAIEQASSSAPQATLAVLVPSDKEKAEVQERLESAAQVANIRLEDAFGKVVYTTADQAIGMLQEQAEEPLDENLSWSDNLSSATALRSSSVSSTSSPVDLAAARLFQPAVVKAAKTALLRVANACVNPETSEPQVVPDFGKLCSAAIRQAQEELAESAEGKVSSARTAGVVRANLAADLATPLAALFDQQLELLTATSMTQLQGALSKLLVSPRLAADMDACVAKTAAAFDKAAKQLECSELPAFCKAAPAKAKLVRAMKLFCKQRLDKAQAGGQFRPVPRKGVTLGFHWLLPKPFGNDYRQEPWQVHATDNMVYVPRDKITDVNANEDWRQQIVPSPIGNDMLYMQ